MRRSTPSAATAAQRAAWVNWCADQGIDASYREDWPAHSFPPLAHRIASIKRTFIAFSSE
jgi:hypothetical protein